MKNSLIVSTFPLILLISSSDPASSSPSPREYKYILKLAPAAITTNGAVLLQDEFRSVIIEVENLTENVVSYYIHDASISCSNKSDVSHEFLSAIVQPRTSSRSSGGILAPNLVDSEVGRGVGQLKVENLGLLGPISALQGCTYSLSVRFIPLNEEDYSLSDKNIVSMTGSSEIR